MKIYVSHTKRSPFEEELYKPLREANLPVEFIFPHEERSEPYDSKELFERKGCDLVLAEVSYPATGQGVELAWANANNIPIICIFKSGSDISGSLKFLTDKFIEYETSQEMINKVSADLGFNIA
jgi:hypothetical protein